ncbi:MAG: helix-turn-helix domain-containing protein, partial [Actinomycetota bacterium]
LNELSRQSSVAKATLAQLELGRGNPTLETLMSLATHLGVPLTDIVTAGESPALQVTRAHEGTVVRDDGLEVRLIHRSTHGQGMQEIYDMQVSLGRYDSPAHGNGVREHLIVHQGELTAGPRDSTVTLTDGDFLSFAADRPHLYESRTPVTKATLMLYYPVPPGRP